MLCKRRLYLRRKRFCPLFDFNFSPEVVLCALKIVIVLYSDSTLPVNSTLVSIQIRLHWYNVSRTNIVIILPNQYICSWCGTITAVINKQYHHYKRIAPSYQDIPWLLVSFRCCFYWKSDISPRKHLQLKDISLAFCEVSAWHICVGYFSLLLLVSSAISIFPKRTTP